MVGHASVEVGDLQPFLFFLDTEANRARLLYHRYGLITPAD